MTKQKRRQQVLATKTQVEINARLKGKWINKTKRLAIYIRDGFTCACCGTDLKAHESWGITLDHLVCWADGGTDEASNLVTCCRKCNTDRGDKAWTAFYPAGSQLRVRNAIRRKLNLKLAADLIAGRA
jgi:5-methylcytosine-specific restriction endonuclease McrA